MIADQKTRIVCGEIPEEQVRQFLAYCKELVRGVEKGSLAPSTGMRRIVATQGWEMQVRKLINDWLQENKEKESKPPRWRCAITTVPNRIDLFLRTLRSIHDAGFDKPDVYVDGPGHYTAHYNDDLAGEVHYRSHNAKAYSHWLLTVVEMYLRDAEADRYVVFQDDLVCCKGLRAYLDNCKFPHNGYWNLFTVMGNDFVKDKVTKEISVKQYPFEGWHESNQLGQGGLALVFDNEAVVDLLTQKVMYERMWDHSRRHKFLDGAVVTSMMEAGRKEFIHVPSLVQHTGHISSIGNKWEDQKDVALTFKGENWDAATMIGVPCKTS